MGEVDACNVLFRGEDEDVLEALRIQAKRHASVARHFEPPVGTDALVVREGRSDNPVVALEDSFALVTEPKE